jgi:hypothetical protein
MNFLEKEAYMQVHRHFNYVNLHDLKVVSRCIKNVLQNLMLAKMKYTASIIFDQNMQSLKG